MIEIKYKGNSEFTGTPGHTIAEARELCQKELNITQKAIAVLNGKKIGAPLEAVTVLNDNDNLEFKAAGGQKKFYLVGAILLAMAVTGGIFAYGFTNANTTINATIANSDFATVSANISSPVSWSTRGMERASIGSGTLFDINTLTSGFPGDFSATVSLTNVGDLVTVYRNLSLAIELRDSSNNLVDINGDNVTDGNDYTLLTLDNGSVALNVKQNTTDVYTVLLKGGYFVCNAQKNGGSGADGTPILYCELAQR
jgi:hypothetical protein